MTMIFAKLIRKTFQNEAGTFHLYHLRRHGGEFGKAVYIGPDAPKAFKSVEYLLTGTWEDTPKYGLQFKITSYERRDQPDHRGEGKVLVDSLKHLKE